MILFWAPQYLPINFNDNVGGQLVPDERFDAYLRQVQVYKLLLSRHFIRLSLTIKAQSLSTERTEVRGSSAGVTGAVSYPELDVCMGVGRVKGLGSCAFELG